MADLPPDAYAKAASALVTAVFAAMVLAGGFRRRPNQFLGGFLLLVAANQAFESARAPVFSTDLVLFQSATVAAALDPLFLYYFGSLYPERNRLNDARPVALVAASAAALALAAPAARYYATGGLGYDLALAAFTALAYTAVLFHLGSVLGSGRASEADRLLFPALAVAAIPVWVRLGSGLAYAALAAGGEATFGALRVALSLALVAVVAVLLLRRVPPSSPDRRTALWGTGAGAALGLLFLLPDALRLLGAILPAGGVWSFLAPLRWILFGALGSMAVLRFQFLGPSMAHRRRAARIVVAVGFLGAAAAALAVVDATAGGRVDFGPAEFALLMVALVASQGFRSVVDHGAAKLYGVPMPGDRAAALAAYGAAVGEALAEGRALHDPGLERLRRELGLDVRTAETLKRIAQPEAPAPLAAGQRVAGRYMVLGLLGRGGSGRAFLARDELLQRDVVLKEVLHDGMGSESAVLREARLAGSLQHPNVLTVFDVIARPASSLIATEYVPGGSLHERLRSGGLAPGEAWRLMDGILAGLEAVHGRGIVHGDLKPANVLLASSGNPKIADFGLARARRGVTVARYEAAAFAGTPAYMAPELRAGGLATVASDIYAAGLLLREVGGSSLPGGVEEVAGRAMAPEPEARWSSARAMRDALREAAGRA